MYCSTFDSIKKNYWEKVRRGHWRCRSPTLLCLKFPPKSSGLDEALDDIHLSGEDFNQMVMDNLAKLYKKGKDIHSNNRSLEG